MSVSAGDDLTWPPKKEDLERLYVSEKLSAAKVAKAYGLRYSSPKVAESTILYHLKRNGILRRDRVALSTKFSEKTVDEWVERYNAGESLKDIAGDEMSPVTVFLRLRKRGVELRDKVEAQIQTVTKYKRLSFEGDSKEKAYLMGLRYGDLDVVRHGRAIRVRVSTTHPAMADLFESLFSRYGFVHRYPRKSQLTKYEWNLECDLGLSFEFLLDKPTIEELRALKKDELLAFLAGLFDAEGTLILHNKRGRMNPEAHYTNGDRALVEFLGNILRDLGLQSKTVWYSQTIDRKGVDGPSLIARVWIWRFQDVLRFVREIPFRHQEKISKSAVISKMKFREKSYFNSRTHDEWIILLAEIERDRNDFVESAGKFVNRSEREN